MSVDPTLAVAPRGAAPLSPFSGPERPAERIIVALDGLQADEAVTMAEAIPDLRWVKVGLELFVSAGPEVVDRLRQAGLSVFLDLKLHDIPATMAGACRRAAGLGARLITVHACAGAEALAAAQAAALEGAQQAGLAAPVLLAVTVLTSWDPQRFRRELAIETPLEPYALQLAGLAAGAGIAGAVCSPLEVAALRQAHPLPFQLVTPGIRPAGSTSGDQRRVLTPAEAVAAGASQLVIGRPITTAPDPAVAFAACCAELS